MEGLREQAVRLYKQLVTSPPSSVAPIVLLPFAVLLLVDPRGGLLVATAPLASFAASFASCSRAEWRRLIGVYMYASPYALAALAARLLGAEPPYGLVNAPMSLLPLGLCGARGLLLYLLYAAASGSLLYGIRGFAISVSSTLLASSILAIALGGKGLSYARAAILAWADDRYDLLESVIGGVHERVEWKALGFERDGATLALVEPGVHYGPFRGVGSSRLPHMLLRASGWRIFALHGCGSHERNMVSSRDAELYAERLAKLIPEKLRRCTPIRPARVEAGPWRGLLLGCVEQPMLLATSLEGVEDIPCDVLGDAQEKLAFIDMHNLEAPYARTEALPQLISQALKAIEPCSGIPRCCWRLVRVPEAEKVNMCADWILYLRLECGEGRAEVVVIPANNIEPRAARLYAEKLPGVDLVTIDDHSCAAAIEEGVAPLTYSDSLVEAVEEARRSCTLRECSLSYAKGSEVVRVWGHETIDEIRELIKRGLRVRYVPLLIYAVPLILMALSAVIARHPL